MTIGCKISIGSSSGKTGSGATASDPALVGAELSRVLFPMVLYRPNVPHRGKMAFFFQCFFIKIGCNKMERVANTPRHKHNTPLFNLNFL